MLFTPGNCHSDDRHLQFCGNSLITTGGLQRFFIHETVHHGLLPFGRLQIHRKACTLRERPAVVLTTQDSTTQGRIRN